MKHIRKSISVLLVLAVLLAFPFTSAGAQSNVIYETSTKQTVTAGVTLEHIVKFTREGWQNINVMRVDLSNKYLSLDTLTNTESVKKLTSTKALASGRGAVAAINASFFNPIGGGSAFPDGTIVESGKVLAAYSEYNRYNDNMASFAMDELNEVLYDYWKTKISLIAPNGQTANVMQFNRPSYQSYNDFTIWDRKWSQTTMGVSQTYPDLTEMLVVDGKVAEIRQAQPAVEIPQNGYVVITRQAGAAFLNNNFKVGDAVEMNIETTPDWTKLKFAVTGSSILVKDGKIPATFSLNTDYINKKNPRTVIGSSKDGKQLILVTVDGRQNASIGMTQIETAQFMLELGAYNALNMDGGGSTTMVARKTGTSALEVVNILSDGSLRPVSTAIGVFSIAPTSALSGMIIDTEDGNVFVNTSRAFTVRGFDRYFNPVEVAPEQIKWSVTGIKGTFKENVFHPTTIGEGKIIATVGTVKAELPISVLSAPVQLELNTKLLKLPLGQTKAFSVTGKNRNGYSAKISPEDVNWSVKGGVGKFEKGTFTASQKGTGYIDAYIGKTHAYCAVSVSAATTVVKNTFEASNGAFLSYPETIKGKYGISTEQKHGGKASGKLSYEFPVSEDNRAAYLVFPDKGLPIDPAAIKIGVWVYNDHENSGWLRAEVMDAAGKKHAVDFAKAMDWTGWKQVEASLEGITAPAFITRLYLAQVNPVEDSGSIYFDDLSVTTSGYPAIDMTKIPKDTVPVDEANKSVTYQKGTNNFRFSVFGDAREPATPLEKTLQQRMSEKINSYLDAAVLVGGGPHTISKKIKKPTVATGTGYKVTDIKNSRFIQLDMSKQGLRTSDPAQWQWFQQQLDTAKGSNVFIFLSASPDTFTDKLEAKLFKDTLTQYRQKNKKNVWVIYKNAANSNYMERGVRYISTAGLDAEGIAPNKTGAAKYLLITVKGADVTFEFKPIV